MADALKLPFAGEEVIRKVSLGADEPDWLLNDRLAGNQLYADLPVEGNSLFTLYSDLRAARWAEIEPYEQAGDAPRVSDVVPRTCTHRRRTMRYGPRANRRVESRRGYRTLGRGRKGSRRARPDGRNMVLTRHCCRELARRREPNRARSGEQPTPPHVHGDSEEIFYVLGGSGLTLLDDKAYEIRAGDCIVYKNFHEAHTIRAGGDGLDVIAFGPREYLGSGELPRGRTMWSITGFIEVQKGHPWDREPNLEWPVPEAGRPATIVNVQDVEPQVRGGRRRRDLAGAAGSRWTGLKHIEMDAGTLRARRTCTPPKRRSSSCSRATALSS